MRQDTRHQLPGHNRTFLAEDPARRLARRVEQFAPPYRRVVQELTQTHFTLEDLADTFPGLLFAFATGFGDGAARERAMAAIMAGRSIRDGAQKLGLPWWLRRLPAQAFVRPLGALPSDHDFGLKISPLMLLPASVTAAWLGRVQAAHEICGAEFALWVARSYRTAAPAPGEDMFALICAWGWHSAHPESAASALLRKRWQSQLSVRRAGDEVAAWRRRIALALCLGGGVRDTWLNEGTVNGYDFVALRTVEAFIAESEAMDNCLDQYANRLDGTAVRVFSVRKNGRPIADIEVSCHEQEVSMPAITQVRGPRNRRAAAEIWQAAYAWIGAQQIRAATADLILQEPGARRQVQRQLWRDYLGQLPVEHRRRFEQVMSGLGDATRRPRAPRDAQLTAETALTAFVPVRTVVPRL
jgi:hypothetical protein